MSQLARRTIMSRLNIAAVASRWSAQHRRTAILGWLGFVLVAFIVGGDELQSRENVKAAIAATAGAQRAHPSVRVEQFGEASANNAIWEAMTSDFHRAEFTSLPITLAILLVAFGAVVAAGIPLLLGMTAVLAALGLLSPLSHLLPVS